MPRKTFPRRDDAHQLVADEVHARHAARTGRPVELPVPIELIVEQTFGLDIVWDRLTEPPGTLILGALIPQMRRIVMNELHVDMFDRWVGPERFTLAHELAHWLYDADSPDQLALDLEGAKGEQFCYHRDSPGLSDDLRIREVNANKLASHLLLPAHLIRAEPIDRILDDFRSTAARWGVSQQTLRIRLDSLGLMDDLDRAHLDGMW